MPQKHLFHQGKFFFYTGTPVDVAKLASTIWLQCATDLNITPIQNVRYDTTLNNF